MIFLSDKNRFLFGLAAVLLGGFFAVASIGFYASRQSIRAGISEQSLPLASDIIFAEIKSDLLRPVLISSMMAHDTFLHDWIRGGERRTETITQYLANIRQQYGVGSAFLVSDLTFNHYLPEGLHKQVRKDSSRSRWYFRVREMAPAHEVNLDPDELQKDRFNLYVNYKVVGTDGKFLGATGVALTLDTISALIDRYEGAFQRHIYFVDQSGVIFLAGSGMAEAGRSIRDSPGIDAIANDILSGTTTSGRFQYHNGNTLVLVNSRFIPELSSFLIVEQSEEGADMRGIERTFIFNLGVSALVSLIVLALVHLLVRHYQIRISAMAREAIKNAERELELARGQQEFVAMVSHEFCTPLAIIDGSLQGMKHLDITLPSEVSSRIRKIHRASLRLRELMGNYLTTDRLRHADGSWVRKPLDLFELVERIARRAELSNLSLRLPNEPAFVTGDPELLGIVFFNLINNASKHSGDADSIEISGSVLDGFVEVTVLDHGAGIHPDDLPRIFEKYYRAKDNATGGTGLGLYVVRKIISMHGGTVTACSKLSSGSHFCVRLPRVVLM